MIGNVRRRFKEGIIGDTVNFMLLEVHNRTALIIKSAVVVQQLSVVIHFKDVGITVVIHQIAVVIPFAEAVTCELHSRKAVRQRLNGDIAPAVSFTDRQRGGCLWTELIHFDRGWGRQLLAIPAELKIPVACRPGQDVRRFTA